MIEIKHCKINTFEERDYSGGKKAEYFLKITIKLPGGVAIYDIPISKDVKDNLEVASKLGIAQ